MNFLSKKLTKKQLSDGEKPVVFNLQKKQDRFLLEKTLKQNPQIKISDEFLSQLEELFIAKNPSLIKSPVLLKKELGIYLQNIKLENLYLAGNWVLYPWLNTLCHILSEPDFYLLRTSRNHYLITPKEQEKFYNSTIGIAGLSVGNSVALSIVLQGGSKHMKIADFDTLALSNTNRVRAGIANLGIPKTIITARQLYEINPYAHIELFSEGITKENVARFTKGLSVLVDETDTMTVKLLLRMQAKKMKLPVVMGADNADSAVIDIERYDKKNTPAFFHNRLGNISYEKLSGLSKFETGKTIAKFIGLENHTPSMLTSLKEIGNSIVSWPQLGGTAQLTGAAVAYCVRSIVTGKTVISNRAIIAFNETFDPKTNTKKYKKQKHRAMMSFKKIFSL